ncbi:efflux RND transporter permease subunit [Enhygromyxa salina]|uniref:MMPL family protein n=1 Tax=Enhygromyxa salina TaxID=215803 RepID=A0A2S9XT14_9BACT|nr:MMPL family transporter [Enhygromyxa salina]PRP96008.1 MMPL family protein [Enhygromyxa salina]
MSDGDDKTGSGANSERLHPIVRARWAILVVFVALCAWLIPGVAGIQNDDDVLAFLPPDHPEVINFQEVADRFGMTEVALVGLSDGGADMLAPQRVAKIRELSTQIKQLGEVKTALSFADLPNPVVNEDGLVVDALVPSTMTDPAQIRAQVLGSRDAVGNLISADGKAAALMVFLIPRNADEAGAEAFAARRATLDELRATVEDQWEGEAYFAGAPYIEMAASTSSRADIERLSPIVIGVLAVASALLLGSVTAAVLNLLVTGLGVALIMGAHGRFDEALTIVSSSTPVMMVALGGAFGMHILAGYQRRKGTSQARASATLDELWKPVLMSGATTAVAFFALYVMPQVPMQRFGVIAGIGVLLLLVLALLVLPALLAVLPDNLLQHKPERPLPIPGRPPWWLLVAIAAVSLFLARGMSADVDTANVFDEGSEVRVANNFFDDNFGGSTYLQVTIEADIGEAEVLRTIRNISEEVRAIEGVVDVRSVYDPVEVLNAALGGRRGVPETTPRAKRVLTYLIGHPAMVQLMTDEADGALIHIKLAPMNGDRQVEATAQIREVVQRHAPADKLLRVASSEIAAVAEHRDAQTAARLGRLTDAKIDVEQLRAAASKPPAALIAKVIELRDGLDDEEEGVFMMEIPGLQSLDPTKLLVLRGAELEAYMREQLPTAVAEDAEGIGPAAKHLGAWIDEAKGKYKVEGWCAALDFEARCDELRPALAELQDEAWAVPASLDLGEIPDGAEVREVAADIRLTGQPVIGQAFAQSVTKSLLMSTLVSIAALGVVLLLTRSLFALVPAIWTLAFSAGIIAALGHPISVGTSMVACIALGAGVDFAIHLGFRARSYQERGAGDRAVRELGAVVVISAVQLALAFSVLLLSEMPPLQQFGIGLAISLVGAALGAVWFTPMLIRDAMRDKRGSDSKSQSVSKSAQ